MVAASPVDPLGCRFASRHPGPRAGYATEVSGGAASAIRRPTPLCLGNSWRPTADHAGPEGRGAQRTWLCQPDPRLQKKRELCRHFPQRDGSATDRGQNPSTLCCWHSLEGHRAKNTRWDGAGILDAGADEHRSPCPGDPRRGCFSLGQAFAHACWLAEETFARHDPSGRRRVPSFTGAGVCGRRGAAPRRGDDRRDRAQPTWLGVAAQGLAGRRHRFTATCA